MAYGKKYIIKFKNRLQNDIYRCEIWQKDFVGDPTDLIGADSPFVISWTGSDTDILNPVKAFEITLSINTNTLTINDFYSDDDEEFRTDFYFESLANGTGTAKLLYSAYLIEDGVSEPVTDRKHVLTLKATDNLGLLKNIKWNEIGNASIYYGSFSLHYYINRLLRLTGLFNESVLIDQSLPLRIYDNLFENTTDDRTVSDTKDPFTQTVIPSTIFQNSDGTWQDCYTILSTILKNKNACIIQADGCWNIIRMPEYSLFTNGAIAGTEYIYNGSGTDINAVTLNDAVSITRNGTELVPVLEDQTNSIQRPLRSVKNTFNYRGFPLIFNIDLQFPSTVTPYDTNTVGDIIYSKYDLTTCFPFWAHWKSDDSYLQTEFSISQNREIDRYIVTPGHASQQYGVLFNPISVTAKDLMSFSLRFKMLSSDSNTLRFWIRFILFLDNGFCYHLICPIGGGNAYPRWAAVDSTDFFDEDLGIYYEIAASDDKTQWTDYDFETIATSTSLKDLPFPGDGMLSITVFGTNGSNTSNRQEVVWKDLDFSIQQYVNDSTKVIGQTHFDAGTSTIKAVQENQTDLDDSPRNTIAGTLFTDALTDFGYTDTVTGESTGIGNIFFTKTTLWHRKNISEALRLGNIITQERLRLNYTTRLIREGSFKNLRYDTNKFVSLLSLFTLGDVPDKYLAPASLTLDYMNCVARGKLLEIFKDDEDDFDDTYLFNYLYETT